MLHSTDVKPANIAKISEATSDATYISIISTGSGGYEATIDELIEYSEDEEDIREGLKSLAEAEGSISLEEYERLRAASEGK